MANCVGRGAKVLQRRIPKVRSGGDAPHPVVHRHHHRHHRHRGVHPKSHKHKIPYMGFCASIWDSVRHHCHRHHHHHDHQK